jgi:ABC-type phosphate transport system permease subunit
MSNFLFILSGFVLGFLVACFVAEYAESDTWRNGR